MHFSRRGAQGAATTGGAPTCGDYTTAVGSEIVGAGMVVRQPPVLASHVVPRAVRVDRRPSRDGVLRRRRGHRGRVVAVGGGSACRGHCGVPLRPKPYDARDITDGPLRTHCRTRITPRHLLVATVTCILLHNARARESVNGIVRTSDSGEGRLAVYIVSVQDGHGDITCTHLL